ncbi:MAG: phosphotransferase [Thermomicrobiales bacterium]
MMPAQADRELTPDAYGILKRLLADAGLPESPREIRPLTGRGFENGIFVVTPAGRDDVIFRLRPEGAAEDAGRVAFLAAYDLPIPRVLAMEGRGALHEFIHGRVIGDAIESGEMTGQMWRHVGEAFRKVHAVRFPDRLAGMVGPNEIVLHPCDPVAGVQASIERALPRLRLMAFDGAVKGSFERLHGMVEMLDVAIRRAPVSLVHDDVNMWNIIVDAERAVIIDWDYPAVKSSLREIALLDKHAWLFNGLGRVGLPEDFCMGYGEVDLPVVELYRVLETVVWAVSDDWATFARRAAVLSPARTSAAMA